ncbi:MFS transporter [Marinomonas pollencensis]|uniref:Putative MFS family arabinose efflux permease n=1 Tax=Marinomonas pollencensis TaxID=491954 RepID=A0A3E0DKQ0_9GAMM|nr:MFS transporter [Marinomonas pollencensis]REG83213.1 putative MFS family arabinose efflux permease [Marinomonas pollencensis]
MKPLSSLGSFTLLCISCLTIMVGAVVAPGLSDISQALGVADNASLLVTIPALGVVLFAPISGRLIDRFGAYYCTLIALFLYGALGLSGQWLSGPTAVFANRIILGATVAVIMAGGTTLISQFYSGHARLTMIAKQGMAIELGGVIFLFVGGFLATVGWNLPFLLYLMAWVFLAMLITLVPNNKPLHNEPESAPTPTTKSTSEPLRWVYISACVAMVLFFTSIIVLPLSMEGSGYSADQVGMFLAFISLVAVVTAHFLPKINLRWKDKGTLGFAFAFYALSHIAFYFGEALPMLLLGGVFAGIGFGLSIPLFNHITIEKSDPRERGKNLSYLAMSVFLGQFLTSFMELFAADLRSVYLVAAVLSVLYFICVLNVFKEPQAQPKMNSL